MKHRAFLAIAALLPAACSANGNEAADTQRPAAAATETAPSGFRFPDSVAAFGDGYPEAGDPCRKLGETQATAEFLDDSAQLVGCPTAAQAAALDGKVAGVIDGVTLALVPLGSANRGMAPSSNDALVPGTKYHATALIPCGFGGAAADSTCEAGVVRQWGEEGRTLVEVKKPDGRTRAIFFRNLEAYGADSAQADGSAGWDFAVTRDGDRSIISYGPERYVIVDALIEGG